MTNREIAQVLFITTKTAKAHLGHVYRKLEITRRGQLAGVLSSVPEAGREDPGAAAAISSQRAAFSTRARAYGSARNSGE